MKNLLLITSLFASLFFIVNCSPNKSSTGSVGTATAQSACPAGYSYVNGQCYYGTSSTSANYNYSLGFYADNHTNYGSSIQITNVALMKQLFKLGMGVCDLASNNYGLANCDAYIQGQLDIVVQFPADFNVTTSTSESALVTIFAYPAYNAYYNYQASFGSWWQVLGGIAGIYIPDTNYYSGAYRNPLQIQMQASPINSNQGFSATGYGDAWTGFNQTLVTVEVTSGNPGNSSTSYFNYNLKIGGQTAATGRMIRCQTMNCGI
ncbi:MAG: hypothetical protein ACXWQQ_08035 [Pseudobdellovibrio sp.]